MINAEKKNLFVSSACLSNEQPIDTRISQYMANGLDAIELGNKILVNTESLSHALQLKAKFLVHNYFPPPRTAFVLNLASDNIKIHRQSFALAVKAIDISAAVDATFYSVHAGFCFHLAPEMLGDVGAQCRTGSDCIIPYEKAYKQFLKTIVELSAYAKVKGVRLLIENNVIAKELACAKGKNILLLTTSDEILQFMKDVSDSNVGILLDTGHLNVSAHTLGFDRLSFVEEISRYIRAVHIHDNDGTADTHQPIGEDSWVFDILERSEFANMPFIIEAKFKDIQSLSNHINWLKTKLAEK